MNEPPALRAKILDAALTILHGSGIRALSQAKVAAAVGIRQSHLQYYFPKKIDLVIALLRGHVDMASHGAGSGEAAPGPGDGRQGSIDQALEVIAADPGRMRFFLGLIMEAEDEPALRTLLDEHVEQFHAEVAAWFGRQRGDADVEAFLNTLRGHGMLNLLRKRAVPIDIGRLAARFGLTCKDR